MTKVVFAIIQLLLCIEALAQGVNFRQISFNEAVSTAGKENKMLFVDCYTTWCGPCKAMKNNIFVLKDVGDFFNENFVSIMLDMEKPESFELSKLYSIRSYPTFMFFSSTGNVTGILIGSSPSGEDWLNRVKETVKQAKQIDLLREIYNTDKSIENAEKLLDAFVNINFKEGISELLNEQFLLSTDKNKFMKENYIKAKENITDITLPFYIYIYENTEESDHLNNDSYKVRYKQTINLSYMRFLTDRVGYDSVMIAKLNAICKQLNFGKKELAYHYPNLIRLKENKEFNKILDYFTKEMIEVSNEDIFLLENQISKIKGMPESFIDDVHKYCIEKRGRIPVNYSKSLNSIIKERINK